MPAVKPLTFEERKLIEMYASTELSACKIAARIGRSKNVVVTEYRRNGGREKYTAQAGQKNANDNIQSRKNKLRIRLDQLTEENIIKYAEAGYTRNNIIRLCSVSGHRVDAIIKEHKVELKTSEVSLFHRVETIEMQLNLIIELIKDLKL